MPDRPPMAEHNYTVHATANDPGARAVGLALVNISGQLDRIIELLEAALPTEGGERE
jgi:hypothetical protein